jgi:hypothetical protein
MLKQLVESLKVKNVALMGLHFFYNLHLLIPKKKVPILFNVVDSQKIFFLNFGTFLYVTYKEEIMLGNLGIQKAETFLRDSFRFLR